MSRPPRSTLASRRATLVAVTILLSGCGVAAPSGRPQPPAPTLAAGSRATPPALSPAPPAPATSRSSHSRLTLISEPEAGVMPFLRLIAAACHSIELTMYELTDQRVESALVSAARRGVHVRVLVNGGYYRMPDARNRAATRMLRAGGVSVRDSPSYFALTHQKTLTVDDVRSAVMTLNFDGRYASTRDFAVVDRQPADVRAILATFNADWASRRTVPSTGTGDLVWSPGAEPRVLALIRQARHTLELESEEMDDPPATAALCAAARRGVNVEIIMSDDRAWRPALEHLRGCGAHVHLRFGQSYYIHAKLLIVDAQRALVGSQNLSPTSLWANRELGIMVSAPPVLASLSAEFRADLRAAAPG